MFHKMDAYRDDEHKWVTFCTICGVEEPPMGDLCKGYHESAVITDHEWNKLADWPEPSDELKQKIYYQAGTKWLTKYRNNFTS